jgi:hypothetical protein
MKLIFDLTAFAGEALPLVPRTVVLVPRNVVVTCSRSQIPNHHTAGGVKRTNKNQRGGQKRKRPQSIPEQGFEYSGAAVFRIPVYLKPRNVPERWWTPSRIHPWRCNVRANNSESRQMTCGGPLWGSRQMTCWGPLWGYTCIHVYISSTSLSVTGITRCSAWVHLGKTQLRELSRPTTTPQGPNTDLVYFGIKNINWRKDWNIEKYVKNKLQLKISLFWY